MTERFGLPLADIIEHMAKAPSCAGLDALRADKGLFDSINKQLAAIGLTHFTFPQRGSQSLVLDTDMGFILRIAPKMEKGQAQPGTPQIDEVLQPIFTLEAGNIKIDAMPRVLPMIHALPTPGEEGSGIVKVAKANEMLDELQRKCETKNYRFSDKKLANIGLIIDPKTLRLKDAIIIDPASVRAETGAKPDSNFPLQSRLWEKLGLGTSFKPLGTVSVEQAKSVVGTIQKQLTDFPPH